MENTKYLLEMSNITKEFPGVKALDGANLKVRPHSVHALMGENGAGKSTLMKCLFGIYEKDSGSIIFEGKEINFKSAKEALDNGVSMVHQELNQVLQRNILDNIWLGRYPKKGFFIDEKKMYEDTKKIFEDLDISVDPRAKMGDLAVSERQMVEIAKAVSYNSKIIVMDEPTSSLTEKEVEHLFKIINKLRERGCGIVYISHKMEEIKAISDDITIMRDGKFICEAEVKDIDEEFIIRNMVGRTLDEQFPRVKVERGKEILRVENLKNSYVDGVSFSLHEGEILGISGLMGAGRSELVKTIYGHLKKDSGKVFIDGEEKNIRAAKEGIECGIAYVSEDRKGDGLVLGMSVKENMTLSALNFFSTLFKLEHKKEEASVEEYIGKFRVKTPSMEQKIKNLSGGNQQKVAIAKALLTNPKILILDEPTRGVDVGAKKEIYDFINDLKTKGLSIIMISSEMPEIMGLSDRIMVIHNGKVTGEFLAEEATQEKIMRCAVGGKEC